MQSVKVASKKVLYYFRTVILRSSKYYVLFRSICLGSFNLITMAAKTRITQEKISFDSDANEQIIKVRTGNIITKNLFYSFY